MLAIIITFYKRSSKVREVIEDPGSAIVHVVRVSEGLPDALTVALSVIYAILTFSICILLTSWKANVCIYFAFFSQTSV